MPELSFVGWTEFTALLELRSQSADVVHDLVFHDESFSERCSGNMRPWSGLPISIQNCTHGLICPPRCIVRQAQLGRLAFMSAFPAETFAWPFRHSLFQTSFNRTLKLKNYVRHLPPMPPRLVHRTVMGSRDKRDRCGGRLLRRQIQLPVPRNDRPADQCRRSTGNP